MSLARLGCTLLLSLEQRFQLIRFGFIGKPANNCDQCKYTGQFPTKLIWGNR